MSGTLTGNRPMDLQTQITSFYASQMQLLDSGECDAWAVTFTEDGVFTASGLPEPVYGRQAIAAGASAAHDQLVRSGVVHRHWLGMVSTAWQEDGTVRARCYALVIETPRGGKSVIHRSTVCKDILVPSGDSWQVREREVARDDLLDL
jgi:3-phenylpropionate/cinnamic acid dioxygenase small subunit